MINNQCFLKQVQFLVTIASRINNKGMINNAAKLSIYSPLKASVIIWLFNSSKYKIHFAKMYMIPDIKHMENGEQPGEAVIATMFRTMQNALAEQKQSSLSVDDVTGMIAGQIGQLAPMDEKAADLFQKLAKMMIEQVEK